MSLPVPGIIACRSEPIYGSTGDTYWENVVLLMHFDSNLVDEVGNTITDAGLSFDSSNKMFGTASVIGGIVGFASASHTNFDLSAVDLTIECFVYLGHTDNMYIIRPNTGNGIYFYTDGSRYLRASNSVSSLIVSDTQVPLLTWTHIAVTRSSGTLRLFINGVKQTNEVIGGFDSNNNIYIAGTGSNNLNRIDELRITRGVARYIANFTPPTEQFPKYLPIDPIFTRTEKEVFVEEQPEPIPNPTHVPLMGAGGRFLIIIGSYAYQVRKDGGSIDYLVRFNKTTFEVTDAVTNFGACDPRYNNSGILLGCNNIDHTIHSICTDGTNLYISAYKDLRKYDSSLNVLTNVVPSVTYEHLCYANSFLWGLNGLIVYKINPSTLAVVSQITVAASGYIYRLETDGTHLYVSGTDNTAPYFKKINGSTEELTIYSNYSGMSYLICIINGYAYFSLDKINLTTGVNSSHSLVLGYDYVDVNRHFISKFNNLFTHYAALAGQNNVFGKGTIRVIDSTDDSIISTITNFEELLSYQCGNICITEYKKPVGIGLLSETKLIISDGSNHLASYQDGYSIYDNI